MPSSTTNNTTTSPQPLPTRTTSTRIQPPPLTPSKSTSTKRPALPRRRTTAQTRYITMLLELDTVPKLHNILASASVWILLAGYIVFPATFNKIQRRSDESEHRVLREVKNVPLLYVAGFACGMGVLGCLGLWVRWRGNYVWVVNRIFLPALMNSLAGLISTIVNVYSAQDGQYSVTAKVTIVVTATCTVCAMALFLVYNCVMLAIVKRRHDREVKAVEEIDGGMGVEGREMGEEKVSGRLGAVGKDAGRVV